MSFIDRLYYPDWKMYLPSDDPLEVLSQFMSGFDRYAINRVAAHSDHLNYLLTDEDMTDECRDLVHAMNFCPEFYLSGLWTGLVNISRRYPRDADGAWLTQLARRYWHIECGLHRVNLRNEGLAIAAFRELIGFAPKGSHKKAAMVLSRVGLFDPLRSTAFFRPAPPNIDRFNQFIHWDVETEPNLRQDAEGLDKGRALEKTLEPKLGNDDGQPVLNHFQAEIRRRGLMMNEQDAFVHRFVAKIPDYKERLELAMRNALARAETADPKQEAQLQKLAPILRGLEHHHRQGTRFMAPLGSTEDSKS